MSSDRLEQLQLNLGERYAIEREIARGGMATVYLAKDPRYGRQVALKIMDAELAGTIGVDRFLREIEIAARLTHPHIVPLYDSGAVRSDDSSPVSFLFYVMPFIAGESLRDRLNRTGPFALTDVVGIVREVASALDYAHRQGVVHRDIKPENILLSEGHAVVTDFGVARAVVEAADTATITQVGMIVGTPAYMSAEQAGGTRVLDGRSDQYSLACVVHELLTGHPPFSGTSAIALLAQHLAADPPPLRTTEPIPDVVERAIHRALAKEPDDRFKTVREFAESLGASDMESRSILPRLPGGAGTRPAHRLPSPLTPLIGRERDVATLIALLQRASVRLVTLHGPGGIGKTRLALDVAHRSMEFFPDGVHFVSLTEVRDTDTLYVRIGQAVGLRGGIVGSLDALRDQFVETRVLLVLDNFEQIVHAAPVITHLLSECPGLTALVTSQVLLHVYGEHEFPVGPLPIPDQSQTARAEDLAQSPAIRLFVERAIAVQPDFTLDDDNLSAVRAICVRLDGVPLAIELAAARVKSTPPHVLLPRLAQSLEVLTGGARDMPARQRTMRGAIAWCHDLLAPAERTLFRRLSLFAGGSTASTATTICADASAADDVEDILTSLTDHSLLRKHTDATGTERYLMLRPIHAFAAEALDAAGEDIEYADRHASVFSALALDAEPHVVRGDESCLDRLEVELDNLYSAVDHLATRGATSEALRTAVALWRFWEARSYAREGLDRLRRLLDAAADAPVTLRLKALFAAGVLADTCGDYATGRRLFEEHLAITRELGDPRAALVACNNLAVVLLRQGDAERAIPMFETAIAAIKAMGDLSAAALGIANIGNAERLRRNFDAARARYDEALRIFVDAGDDVNVAWSLSHLGDLALDEGDRVQARAHYRASLAKFAGLQHRRGMASVLTDLGELMVTDGNPLAGRAMLEEALVHSADAGDQRAMIRVLEGLSAIATMDGQPDRALKLAGAVAGLRDGLGAPLSSTERARLERRVAPAMAHLGRSASEAAWREGLSLSMDGVLRYLSTPVTV